MTPSELRKMCARGEFVAPTAGYCDGHVQANLAALPETYASDFELFCRKNPKPCPLLEKIGPGSCLTRYLADKADLRKTLPRYRIWIDGRLDREVGDIAAHYRDDLVFFLLGCSFSFEAALMESGITLRHFEQKKNVAMFDTNIALNDSGPFGGNMVVSMRPIPKHLVNRAVEVTGRFPEMHGDPVHVGNPREIGIRHPESPDYGDPMEIFDNEVPVFWACGVTPQAVLLEARPSFAITHAPGFMFVSDLKNGDFCRE